jgi:shikimate kinase
MNVVMVGFMGSGKTAVGRRLAQRLGYHFLDTDHFIESELGCTIAELFTSKGEAAFRELEARMAERLRRLDNHVISTGGGMVAAPGNLERLKAAGLVVFLKAELKDILARLERDTRRPMLQGHDLQERVANLMTERLPLYEQSDIVVETGGKGVNRVAGEIIRRVAELERSRAAGSS